MVSVTPAPAAVASPYPPAPLAGATNDLDWNDADGLGVETLWQQNTGRPSQTGDFGIAFKPNGDYAILVRTAPFGGYQHPWYVVYSN